MTKENLEEKCLWKAVINRVSSGKIHIDLNKCKKCPGYDKFCQDYDPIKNYRKDGE